MHENIALVIDNVKDRILSKITPTSIILFGSLAKGNDSQDSDIDLLIVWDEHREISNVKRRIALRKAIGIINSPIDIITCTTEEFKRALEDENSFTSQIVKEGEVLYGGLN